MPTSISNHSAAKNDYLSLSAKDLVPDKYRGTDQYLEMLCWNICYFNNRDKKRVQTITGILEALNADIIVLEEVMQDSLKEVIDELAARGAGYYQAAYGTTGGDQRIAILYDTDWVRAKDTCAELFAKGQILTSDGKDAFPRLPLWGYLSCRTDRGEPFDFQLVGLHLKSQLGGGGPQRRMAADELSKWLVQKAPKVDSDVVMIGDWNETPTSETWAPLHKLEDEGKAAFRSVNDESDISHLMYRNKREFGSRLDLRAISMATEHNVHDPGGVVHWKSFQDLVAGHPNAAQLKKYIKEVKDNISDHMPVYMSFYYEEDPAVTRVKQRVLGEQRPAA